MGLFAPQLPKRASRPKRFVSTRLTTPACRPIRRGEIENITVRTNWRIIFKFHDGNATGVELIDYH